jgi:uncharacterized membrane protein YeiH
VATGEEGPGSDASAETAPELTVIHSRVTVLASGVLWWHGWKWTGSFTTLDLIAAFTNGLNGALLARRPDHYKNFTVIGIILMAFLMGIGGGVTRDVLLTKIPGAFTNPAYIVVVLGAGIIGYAVAYDGGQLFREGLFQFMTSFSLPLYAITGAQAAVQARLPVLGVLAIAVIGPTAGRWYVDVSCGVPPKQFIRSEWFVTTALLTGIIWVICDSAGLPSWACALIAFVIGYTFRVLALYNAWEEPLAREPKGVYIHDDGRPMLGRKLKGKSQREMAMLGLTVNGQDQE